MPESRTGPLMTESTVELYRRAREQRGKPAPPDARAVGALYELILAVHAADPIWHEAALRSHDEAWGKELEYEREVHRKYAYQAAGLIRDLGGSPPEKDDRAELPHGLRDIQYAADETTVRARIEEDRERLREAVARARESLVELANHDHDRR